MKIKKHEAQIPKPQKNKNKKRCYMVWRRFLIRGRISQGIVWLTERELFLAKIKYSKCEFREVLEKDRLEYCKTLMDRDYGYLLDNQRP